MAKTATIAVADPARARREVIDRVLGRAKVPEPHYQIDSKTGAAVNTAARVTGDGERQAAKDLGEWADDRTVACFGGRVRLNPVEQAAFGILEAMRGGDPGQVAAVVRKSGGGLDELQQHAVYPVLEMWKAKAPGFAAGVASAAVAEAKRAGWDQRPSRRVLQRITAARAKVVDPDTGWDDRAGQRLAPVTRELLGAR